MTTTAEYSAFSSPASTTTPGTSAVGGGGAGVNASAAASAAAGGTTTPSAENNNNNNNNNQEGDDDDWASLLKPVDEEDVIASCENIHKTYLLGVEGVPALRGVSADIYKRDFCVIYGTSGGGKSTLLNVFGTIDIPTKGNLQLFNHRITENTADEHLALLRCKKIGFVFQSFNLLSTMTAVDNVSLPMIIAGELGAEAIRSRAADLLTMVGLGHRLTHFPSQLSGGESQRVAIARALANEPQVLLLDEPTGDLDSRNTHIVMNILLDLNIRKGLTMIMVTHDVYMKKYATRVLHLRDGRLSREERVDHSIRIDSIRELKESITREKQDLQNTLNEGKQNSFIEEIRKPQEYATYTKRASQKVFFKHEHPVLFKDLFGENRALNSSGGSTRVSVGGVVAPSPSASSAAAAAAGGGNGEGNNNNRNNNVAVTTPTPTSGSGDSSSSSASGPSATSATTTTSQVVGNTKPRHTSNENQGEGSGVEMQSKK